MFASFFAGGDDTDLGLFHSDDIGLQKNTFFQNTSQK
jgi:hypothetical protein